MPSSLVTTKKYCANVVYSSCNFRNTVERLVISLSYSANSLGKKTISFKHIFTYVGQVLGWVDSIFVLATAVGGLSNRGNAGLQVSGLFVSSELLSSIKSIHPAILKRNLNLEGKGLGGLGAALEIC